MRIYPRGSQEVLAETSADYRRSLWANLEASAIDRELKAVRGRPAARRGRELSIEQMRCLQRQAEQRGQTGLAKALRESLKLREGKADASQVRYAAGGPATLKR